MLFFAHVFQGKPLFNTFNFPAKKLRKKYGVLKIRMRRFFFFLQLEYLK